MNGLFFYKLVSPYKEDVTKDCKLTVNEIDHNFMTLKEADVVSLDIDNENGFLVVGTRGGDQFKADISHFTTDVSVNYDKENGRLEISHDGVVDVIDGIVTNENVSQEIIANIITDETLIGNGRTKSPIGLSSLEKTSAYKSAIKLIDKTQGCSLPRLERNKLGDRYVTYENYNEYGYLYKYASARMFANEVGNGWRLPTKADWDNMLNAIEFCDEDRNHDSMSGSANLGKVAGKLLKSVHKWANSDISGDDCIVDFPNCDCVNENHFHLRPHHHDCNHDCNCNCDCHPIEKPMPTRGTDNYGFKVLPSGYGDGGVMMDYFGKRAKFWTSTETQVTNVYTKRFDYDKASVVQLAETPCGVLSVRLVKDYDGTNFKEIENIGGINYKCVLMPSKNTTHGYAIWMASNVATTLSKYNPVEPNNGDIFADKQVYFINEWNGFDWMRKEMVEGDSIVFKNGPDGDTNTEYRLVNGEFINIKKNTIAIVENKYDDKIAELDTRVGKLEVNVSTINDQVVDIYDKLEDSDATDAMLLEKIKEEARLRESGDRALDDKLEHESAERIENDRILGTMISEETRAREEADARLQDNIDSEAADRLEKDIELEEKINLNHEKLSNWLQAETEERAKADAALHNWIESEVSYRENGDNALKNLIDNESIVRANADSELNAYITREVEERERADETLLSNINNETSEREKADEVLNNWIATEVDERQKADIALSEKLDAEINEREQDVEELNSSLSTEREERESADRELKDLIDAVSDSASVIGQKLDDEIARSIEQDKRLISQQGNVYDSVNGTLTLKADDPKYDIVIELNGNYGTF